MINLRKILLLRRPKTGVDKQSLTFVSVRTSKNIESLLLQGKGMLKIECIKTLHILTILKINMAQLHLQSLKVTNVEFVLVFSFGCKIEFEHYVLIPNMNIPGSPLRGYSLQLVSPLTIRAPKPR